MGLKPASESQEMDDKVQRWLQPASWPIPNWYYQNGKQIKAPSYEALFTYRLRTRFINLENDFRTVVGNHGGFDLVTTERIFDLLHASRKALEHSNPDLMMVSDALDLCERYMIWMYPSYMVTGRILTLIARLEGSELPNAKLMVEQLCEISQKAWDEGEPWLGRLRGLFDEAIDMLNQRVIEIQISNGLQLERLRSLRFWSMILVIFFLAVSPLVLQLDSPSSPVLVSSSSPVTKELDSPSLPVLVSSSSPVTKELDSPSLPVLVSSSSPVTKELDSPSLPVLTFGSSPIAENWFYLFAKAWLTALGIATMGALGGFISGLLQVRNSRVSLKEYQESMLLFQLKPIVGALVSLVLYVLLSWGILPGVTITNLGSYILLAFLSGFSERYFLRLLELQPEGEGGNKQVVIVGQSPPAAKGEKTQTTEVSKLSLEGEVGDKQAAKASQALPATKVAETQPAKTDEPSPTQLANNVQAVEEVESQSGSEDVSFNSQDKKE